MCYVCVATAAAAKHIEKSVITENLHIRAACISARISPIEKKNNYSCCCWFKKRKKKTGKLLFHTKARENQ